MKKISLVLLIITQAMADQTITDPTTLWDSNAFMQRFAEQVLENAQDCSKKCPVAILGFIIGSPWTLVGNVEKENDTYKIHAISFTQGTKRTPSNKKARVLPCKKTDGDGTIAGCYYYWIYGSMFTMNDLPPDKKSSCFASCLHGWY